MQDQLQIASERIKKFLSHVEVIKSAEDKKMVDQSAFNAQKECFVIQHCFNTILTEAELIYKDAMKHIGVELPEDTRDYEKKVDTTTKATQQSQEQIVVPQFLGQVQPQTQDATPVGQEATTTS